MGRVVPHPQTCNCAECTLLERASDTGPEPPADHLHYDRDGLRIAAFRLPLHRRAFRDTGPIQNFIVVFPRLSVVIHHADKAPVVADPSHAMLYNRGQEYERHALDQRGDACEWFGFPEAVIADALRPADPAVDDRPGRPFTPTHVAVSPGTYLLQRRVFDYLRRRGATADPFLVEDAMFRVLAEVLHSATNGLPRASTSERAASDHRRGIIERTRTLLGSSLGAPLSLQDLGAQVGMSACHLATVFRKETGMTIHAYRTQLRLLTALEHIGDGEEIPEVARRVGFSSHSHFTAAFRRTFGMVPSSWEARTQTLPDRRPPAVGLVMKVDESLRSL